MKLYTSHNKIDIPENTKDSENYRIEFAATYLNGLQMPTLFLALVPEKVFQIYGKEHIEDFLKNLTDFTPEFEHDSLDIKELKGKTLTGILEHHHNRGICIK